MFLGPAGKAANTVLVAAGLWMLCPCLASPILENLPVFDFFQKLGPLRNHPTRKKVSDYICFWRGFFGVSYWDPAGGTQSDRIQVNRAPLELCIYIYICKNTWCSIHVYIYIYIYIYITHVKLHIKPFVPRCSPIRNLGKYGDPIVCLTLSTWKFMHSRKESFWRICN